jgi:nicotinamidase-related amidase
MLMFTNVQVYIVVDACGTFNKDVRDAALLRMEGAGVLEYQHSL